MSLLSAPVDMARLIRRYRRVLSATSRVELARRYAGSVLGIAWVLLQPTLLLSVYLFTYMVIFKVRFPGYSNLDYVVYVFAGLAPYLGFLEALGAGCQVLRQNLHLVKNVMMPIELLPVRAVLVALTTQVVALCLVVLLSGLNGTLGLDVAALPLVLGLQLLGLVGLLWIVSVLTLVVPDVAHFVNLGLLFLMFVSPIGFKPEMVPERLRLVLFANPIFYLTEVYRGALLGTWPPPAAIITYLVLCLASFAAGAIFFRRFKPALVDFE